MPKKKTIKIPVIRQLPSGAWTCQLRLDGESINITHEDYNIVYGQAVAIKSGVVKARKKPEEITLKEACTKYIESRRNRLSPSTVQGYEKIRDNNFPDLMKMKLNQINNSALDEAIENESGRISKRNQKYSPKTIKNAYLFIVSVLNKYAPDIDTRVRLPEVKRMPVTVLTPEDVYKAVKGSSVELPCLLSMWLSLSMSEIRGLTKSKSINNGKLSVVETVVDIKGKPVRKTGGKEEFRSRTLTIPGHIQKLIDDVSGDVIVPDSAQAVSKRFYRLLEKNNLPHINFHKLRHINASVMALLGVPEKDALERGGWKTDNIYKQVYTHTFLEQRQLADTKIDAYFDKIISDITT